MSRGLLAPCGTVAAGLRHYRHGEPACDACKAASAADEKARRERDPEFRARRRQYIAARGRVLSRLAERYPDEMAALLAEELGPDDVTVRQPRKWRTA